MDHRWMFLVVYSKSIFLFFLTYGTPKLVGLVPIQLKLLNLSGSLAASSSNKDVDRSLPGGAARKRLCFS